MKRIVILRCLRSNNVCTGAACMRAFNTKSGAFARYGEEPLELEAYWSCNGCGDCRFEHHAGIEEKLERIMALSRMLCMLAFVLSTARRMARLLPAKLLKKFASAWRLRD